MPGLRKGIARFQTAGEVQSMWGKSRWRAGNLPRLWIEAEGQQPLVAHEARLRRHCSRAWGAGFALRERRPKRRKLVAGQGKVGPEPRDNLHPDPFRICSVGTTYPHNHEEDRGANITGGKDIHSQANPDSNSIAAATYANLLSDADRHAYTCANGHAISNPDQHTYACADGHAEAQTYLHAKTKEETDSNPDPGPYSHDRSVQIWCSDTFRTGKRGQIQRAKHHHNLTMEVRSKARFGRAVPDTGYVHQKRPETNVEARKRGKLSGRTPRTLRAG